LAGATDFAFPPTVKTGSGATGVLSRGQSGWGVKLTGHLFSSPKLRIRGSLPLLPLYAFVARTDTTLPFPSMPLVLPRTYSLCHFIVNVLSLYWGRRATVQLLSAI